MRAFALVVVLAAAAGCAAPEPLGSLTGADDARLPYYKEHRAVVDGEHAEAYPFLVEEGARLVNVTLALDARTNGLPLPETPLEWLDVKLVAPDGVILREARLDANAPTATLVVEQPAAGEHRAQITGFGASERIDGEDYGSAYVLAVEVLY